VRIRNKTYAVQIVELFMIAHKCSGYKEALLFAFRNNFTGGIYAKVKTIEFRRCLGRRIRLSLKPAIILLIADAHICGWPVDTFIRIFYATVRNVQVISGSMNAQLFGEVIVNRLTYVQKKHLQANYSCCYPDFAWGERDSFGRITSRCPEVQKTE
jgi:hypothetical protein